MLPLSLTDWLLVPVLMLLGYVYILRLALRTIRWKQIVQQVQQLVQVMKFAFVGFVVMLIGYVLLYVFISQWHWPTPVAYAVETIISVELNFLGSRYITWRDRLEGSSFWRSWRLFHAARGFTILLSQGLFNLQTEVLGLSYLLANTSTIIVAMAFNYTASNLYAFAPTVRSVVRLGDIEQEPHSVSIVVPCRNNQDSIGEVVEALSTQKFLTVHGADWEIILVGSLNDQTWKGLPDWAEDFVQRYEVRAKSPGRDSNIKRSVGLRRAQGDILVLMDSDVVPDENWLLHIVDRLTVHDYDFVAGPLTGLDNTFWSRFIDRTVSGSKTPRIEGLKRLTIRNIGAFKPPVTANLAFTRQVYQAIGGPDPSFWKSYEDYQFGWEALRRGFTILLDPALGVSRHHREGLIPLMREYYRSGKGCADFLVRYPDSPLSVFRLLQLLALPAAGLVVVAGATLFPVPTLVLVCAGIISMMLSNVLAARRIDGLAYPFIGFFFSLLFVYGVCRRFLQYGLSEPEEPILRGEREV